MSMQTENTGKNAVKERMNKYMQKKQGEREYMRKSRIDSEKDRFIRN